MSSSSYQQWYENELSALATAVQVHVFNIPYDYVLCGLKAWESLLMQ